MGLEKDGPGMTPELTCGQLLLLIQWWQSWKLKAIEEKRHGRSL